MNAMVWVGVLAVLAGGCAKKSAEEQLSTAAEAIQKSVGITGSVLLRGVSDLIINGETLHGVGDYFSGNADNENTRVVRGQAFRTRETSLDEVADDLESLLRLFLANPVLDSATGEIRYTPDASAICAKLAGNNPGPCVSVVGHFTLAQTPRGETAGSLSVRFDGYTPLVLTYAENEFTMDVALSDLRQTLLGIQIASADPGVVPGEGLPSVMEGRVRLRLARESDQSGSIAVGVAEAVHVSGGAGDDHADIQVAIAPAMVVVRLDRALKQVSAALDVFGVELELPMYDRNDVRHPSHWIAPGLAGEIRLDDLAREISFTGVGLRGADLTLAFAGSTAALSIPGFDAKIVIPGGVPQVQVLSNLSVGLVFNDDGDALGETGARQISAAAGTILTPVNGAIAVDSGSVTFEGTGDFSLSLTVNSGSCFDVNAESPGGFPFQTAACFQ
ncbi:MAG: hypothetical protein AB7P04_02425 [Bacteriovoracia bacterium]